MEIINLLHHEAHDIEVQLAGMASSEDRLAGFKGRKLLELVRHLRANGPAPRACGQVMLGELWLTPYNAANRVLLKVWIDWRDYTPLREGLPDAYFRIQIQRVKASLSQDARAVTHEEAEQVIWEAFGWR